jgi:two-component system cell cycle response regulator DivK
MGAASEILIVDDDSRNIFALKAVLKAKGFDCLTATNAREGMRLLSEQNNVGIVLLDMMMPEMDGYEMMRILRNSANKNIPVISVTAQAMSGDKEKCLEAGADAYISKPIDVDVLLELLRQYLK